MNREQYDQLLQEQTEDNLLSVGSLANQEERTLLYGYTCDRLTWHVYLKEGVIHLLVYNEFLKPSVLRYESDYSFKAEILIPDKRLYPAACDYETCQLLVKMGIYLPFTCWDERKESKFQGKLYEELET